MRPRLMILAALAACASAGAQSLYVEGADPYSAVRHFAVGDMIQVSIDENLTADRESQQAVNKQASLNAGITSQNGSGQTTQISLGQSGSGSGSTKKSDQFMGTITCRVDAIQADGTLALKGEQLVDLDGETQKLTLTGLLKPEDVALDRSADSQRLAQVEMHLTNKGIAARGGQLGWLNWILSWIGL
jgi:flagellar L-ring protein precursor FlgH